MNSFNNLFSKIKNKVTGKNKNSDSPLQKQAESIPKAKRNPITPIGSLAVNDLPNRFELKVNSLSELRVAAVMDDFTYQSFAPECHLVSLSVENWKTEMEQLNPDLFFIESAWDGKNSGWKEQVAMGTGELAEAIDYCRKRNIPVVFWNKEDPVHTNYFMTTARLAHCIFTTDVDCISRYKSSTGNNNVFFLHFAAQPKYHNPIERYERKDKFCFAGAYYHEYPDRCRVFNDFYDVIGQTKGMDIYDRNYQNNKPQYFFPEKFQKDICGKLPYTEIDRAYKGYNYGINMNSVSQSQTMFARRVFELLASNTVTVGNYSRGIKNLLGDLTICTDSKKILSQQLEKYCHDRQTFQKYRLLGLRRVLSEHLYEDRLDYIVTKVFGKSLLNKFPSVCIVSFCDNEEQKNAVLKSFNRQNYQNKRLVIISDNCSAVDDPSISILSRENARFESIDHKCEYVAVFKPNDYYGANYLYDIMLSFRYCGAEAVGKANYFCSTDGNVCCNDTSSTYNYVNSLPLCRAIAKKSMVNGNLLSLENHTLQGKLFCCDQFNYCSDCVADCCAEADDMSLSDEGISLAELNLLAEKIEADRSDVASVALKDFYDRIVISSPAVTCNFTGKEITVESKLEENQSAMAHCMGAIDVSPYKNKKEIKMTFMGAGGRNFRGYCTFYDAEGHKLSWFSSMFNVSFKAHPPENADYFILSLYVKGSGSGSISSIIIGESERFASGFFASKADTILVTNHYPSNDNIYSNMFVHKRVAAYLQSGIECDVVCVAENQSECVRQYEGVNVIEGNPALLKNIINNTKIKTICVHFLTRAMWDVIKEHLNDINLIIWSHGADIQPWWRRSFNYTDEESLENAKRLSDERTKLWNEVFNSIKAGSSITIVFVSNYMANEVMKDYGFTIAKENYRVIHNCIDTDLFSYVPKSAEQRMNILSIKSFSARNYANDITSAAIVELSKRPFFKDLSFDIYGDGVLFDECTRDIAGFENVHLHRCFLNHEEIALQHKTHGIFIATTRCDTQGVSRDEAMSSGMVAIATDVTAVPEFADNNCAVLVPNDDSTAVADAIEMLYNNPERFLKLSHNAAERVRNQTAKPFTIDEEIRLIRRIYEKNIT